MELVVEKYKQTELGLIPEDWNLKSISEISNPVRGGSPRPAGDPKYFNGNYIPWLTVAALTNIPLSQLYVSETESCLTEEGSLHSRVLEKETIIIANSGATLGVAKLLGIKCCANDGIAALLDFDKETSKHYLVYFINTQIKYLREVIATGNGQPNLNTGLIGNIKVPLPPILAEQISVATALSDADALISSLEKLIAKKRNIKQGAMQKLLQPKEGWVVKKLEEVCDALGSGKSKTQSQEGQFPIFGSTGIIGWSNTYDYHGHKILVARVGANAGTVNIVEGKYCVSDNTLILSLKLEIDLNFIYSFLILFQLNKLVFGSGQPLITGGQLKSIEVSLPVDKKEQTQIAAILSDMDAEIVALETKLEKYKRVKLGMMQNLLTGKIRLV